LQGLSIMSYDVTKILVNKKVKAYYAEIERV